MKSLSSISLRLGVPFTVIRHEKGAFRKHSSNRMNLKTMAFAFSDGGATITGDCFVSKFFRSSVDREHLVRFQRDTSVFKFLRCSEDGALVESI